MEEPLIPLFDGVGGWFLSVLQKRNTPTELRELSIGAFFMYDVSDWIDTM